MKIAPRIFFMVPAVPSFLPSKMAGPRGTVSYKSVNLHQTSLQNGGVSRALITSLVTRPGSALTLAIIERI